MNLKYFKEIVEQYMPWDEYYSISDMDRTFRINRLKIKVEDFINFTDLDMKKDKYFDFIFHVPKAFKIGNTIEYFLGYIHTQTLSSMLPPIILDPKQNSIVLDLTAAPGGKTTLIADLMENTGCIIANDIKIERLKMLVANIRRLGAINTLITNKDGRKIDYKESFDYVLLDAPCSSLGSSLSTYKIWNPKKTKDFVRIQKKLIIKAFEALKTGGTLVYSTCTFIDKENEGIVEYLLNNKEHAKLMQIDLDIPHDKGLSEYGKEFNKVWRIYPRHLKSEAFFIAKITKT